MRVEAKRRKPNRSKENTMAEAENEKQTTTGSMPIAVRWMSLAGQNGCVATTSAETVYDALELIRSVHADAGLVDDDKDVGYRVTARSPGGRAAYTVAFIEDRVG